MQTTLKYQQITESIRRAIERGGLERGQVLLEGSIATIFTASRSPVRQALSILEDEGLLHRFDGRGVMVGSARVPRVRKDLTPEMLGLDGPVALRKRSWDTQYIEIEHDLLMGSATQPRRINESFLARHYRVSRSLAGQMLARAERSGIIVRTEAGRLSTVTLDAQRVRNFFTLRRLLEPEALIDVARSGRHEAFLRRIDDRLTRARKVYASLTPEQIRLLEYDLHVACIDLNANDALARSMVETRCTFLINVHGWDGSAPFPAFDELIGDHRNILRAMLRKDADLIRRTVVDHIEASLDVTLANLASFQQAAGKVDMPYLR